MSWLKGPGSVFCNMLDANDGVHMTPKNVLETVSLKEDNNEDLGIMIKVLSEYSQMGKCVCNKLQKTGEIKYIQTKLNSFSFLKSEQFLDFPGGAVVKNPPANAGDTGSRPGPGRSHMPRSN